MKAHFIALLALLAMTGVQCTRTVVYNCVPNQSSTCVDCKVLSYVGIISPKKGVIVYDRTLKRNIISFRKKDIDSLDTSQPWYSDTMPLDSFYIPCPQLPPMLNKDGFLVSVLQGTAYLCSGIEPSPYIKVRPKGLVLRNYLLTPHAK